MPRTHKFCLPSNTNKIYSNAYQMPKDIRISEMTIVSRVEQVEPPCESIMVTNDNPIEIKEDDNRSQTIISEVKTETDTIMVTNNIPIEIKADDNRSQTIITEVEEEIRLEIKEIDKENVTIDDKQCVAEIHDIYEDKQSIIKNQLNPLFLKKVELKDMVSMVLSQSKCRKLENKYGWNT